MANHTSTVQSTSSHPAETSLLLRGMNHRVDVDRDGGDIAYFHALLLKLEYLTKIVVSGVVACVEDDSDRHRYSLEYELVRANSLGSWVTVLNNALVGPPAECLISSARHLVRDLTQKVGPGDWRQTVICQLNEAAKAADLDVPIGGRVALKTFFEIGVQIRNRTRGHGAATMSQCSRACPPLATAMELLTQNMEIFRVPWVHLHRNLSGKFRVSSLLNDPSPFEYLKKTRDTQLPNGVYLHLIDPSGVASHVRTSFVATTPELRDILVPNGNYRDGSYEVLSYASNDISRHDGTYWRLPPERLPQSETEGRAVLEQMGNTFANVPPVPAGYVSRIGLVHSVVDELLKVNRHPIVTLTGPGGIGKTTIAIKAIGELSQQEDPPYEVVLWISARDIDLLDTGPKPVSRKVFTQQDIAQAAVELLEPASRNSEDFNPVNFFQNCLSDGAAGPTLFVLDNFETLKDPTDVVEWLDTYIRPPHKVLITTRFRNFRGDYPIEIRGMSEEEATRLIDEHASRLGIAELIGGNYKNQLITESDGHPYVIKILLGQVAKEGRAVNPARIVATADHMLNALFRRTYDALSPAAQRIFLLLSSWRVYVPEVAVEAVSLRPGAEKFDVANALQEAVQFSLADYSDSKEDKERFVGAPLAAALFGQGELEVSPFKLAVEEDRRLLMDFGAGKRKDAHRGALPRIQNLIKAVASRASVEPDQLEQYIPILEYLAQRFPRAYWQLADLVLEVKDGKQSFEQASSYLRRFLEATEIPDRFAGWLRLAELRRACEDAVGEVHALCQAALLPSSDSQNRSDVANRLNNRLRDLKGRDTWDVTAIEIQKLLNGLIARMERYFKDLSATDCSRLAWLYLNVGNSERALEVASEGLTRDASNYYCQRLIDRLNQ